jgi:hypothetical protein
MDNKTISPERIEQLKAMINKSAQEKLTIAQGVHNDEEKAKWDYHKDLLKYIELFDALDTFMGESYKLFDNMYTLYYHYLTKEGDKDAKIFGTVSDIMAVAKEIFSKQDFIEVEKVKYTRLADEIDEMNWK